MQGHVTSKKARKSTTKESSYPEVYAGESRIASAVKWSNRGIYGTEKNELRISLSQALEDLDSMWFGSFVN